MNKWICRVLMVVFFLNTLPADVWAQWVNFAKLTSQVELKEEIQKWKTTQEEVEAILRTDGDTMTLRERHYAELELEIAKTNLAYLNSKRSQTDKQANIAKIKELKESQTQLEKMQELDEQKADMLAIGKVGTLYSFYSKAEREGYIDAAVIAMHKELAEYAKQKEYEARMKQAQQEAAHPVVQVDNTRVELPVLPLEPNPEMDVLKLWEDNNLTIEDLVELIDPLTTDNQINARVVSDAAELLYLTYMSYNQGLQQLDPQTASNAAWMAKRIRMRAWHQLVHIKQHMHKGNAASLLPARGNLMLLVRHTRLFVEKFGTEGDREKDLNLPEWNTVRAELNAGIDESKKWKWNDITNDLLQEVKDDITSSSLFQDRSDRSFLQTNLAFIINSLLMDGNTQGVEELLILINKDGEKYHGENEGLVNTFFATVYNALISVPLSTEVQQQVKTIIRCAAAPICLFKGAGVEQKNAINVRTQALATGSMLRQATGQVKFPDKTGVNVEAPFLNKALFNDAQFRKTMASYAVDVYGPTVEWNVIDPKSVKRYGLDLNELKQFSDHMAFIFETFLPVPEPTLKDVSIKDGPYAGCTKKEIDATNFQNLTTLAGTVATFNNAGYGAGGKKYPCTSPQLMPFGTASTVIALNSSNEPKGIRRYTPEHKYLSQQDIADGLEELTSTIIIEVVSWYLFIGALDALKYVAKIGRAALLASKTAVRAKNGFRLARFESKFAQVWKYSTNAWKDEMGIVNMVKKGEYLEIEMARPGFKGYKFTIPAKGASARTLSGRLRIRRALQSEIFEKHGLKEVVVNGKRMIKGAKASTTTTEAAQLSRSLTKAEQTIVKTEQAQVKAVTQELAKGNSFVQSDGMITVNGAVPNEPLYFDIPELGKSVVIEATENALGRTITTTELDMARTGLFSAGDRFTGNLIGLESGKYYGTVVNPLSQNLVAYDIAAGLFTEGAGSAAPLAPRFAYNWLKASTPAWLRKIGGLTKTVTGMVLFTDPLVYYGYVKPYTTNLAEKNEKELSSAYNVDTEKAEQNAKDNPPTVMDELQSLQPGDNTLYATILGGMLGINQALNWVLPTPIQGIRKDMFNFASDMATQMDRPFAQLMPSGADRVLPLPGQVLMWPLYMFSDFTPGITDDMRQQYRQMGHNQALERAFKGHDANALKDAIDKEIRALADSKAKYMENVKEILSVLSDGKKQMKTIFDNYAAALTQAANMTQEDAEKASEMFVAASKTFANEQTALMRKAIDVYVKVAKPNMLKMNVDDFKKQFGDAFTPAMQQELEEYINQFFTDYEPVLVDLYTSTTPKQVEARMTVANQALQDKIKKLAARVQFARDIDGLLNALNGDENTPGSKAEFLNEVTTTILNSLPATADASDGITQMIGLYQIYMKGLENAKQTAQTDPQKAFADYQQLNQAFTQSQEELMKKAVEAFVAKERQSLNYYIYLDLHNAYPYQMTMENYASMQAIINEYAQRKQTALTTIYTAQTKAKENLKEAAQDVEKLSQEVTRLATNASAELENGEIWLNARLTELKLQIQMQPAQTAH